MDEWLSGSQISKITKISESTTRRYLIKFDSFFKSEKIGRIKKYHFESSISVLDRIQELYSKNYEFEEIQRYLQEEFPFTIEGEMTTIEPKNSIQIATKDDLQEIKEMIKKQNEYISASLEKRDQVLMEFMRDQQERKLNEQKNKGFFKKLLNRK